MTETAARILVIEDEPQIRKFLRIGLSSHQYEVLEADTGEEGLRLSVSRKPDLVILDLGLPDIDGGEVVRRLREWTQLPIIILSVRSREDDKVAVLDAGADDYVVKPFGMGELLARIRASLRKHANASEAPQTYSSGPLAVDLSKRRVVLDGKPVQLTRREYAILKLLVQHAGRVVTHGQILKDVWGPVHERDTQYLRVYVAQLRQKLGDDPANPRFIATEPGVGYRLLEAKEVA